MPGTPRPVGASGGLPVIWSSLIQALRSHDDRISALEGARATSVFDENGNTYEISGTNLAQTVTIGANIYASSPVAGVRVQTGLTGAGRAQQTGLATGTVTLTAGTNTATIVTGSFIAGQQIGAANVTDPSSGTATPAIVPGTVIASIAGSTMTLTPPSGYTFAVAESGTGLYAAACSFSLM